MTSILRTIFILFCTLPLLTTISCDRNDPAKEDVPELVTKVTLTFTESGGASGVSADAIDPDGEGVQDLEVTSPIQLKPNTIYLLKIGLYNTLAAPGAEGYDIGREVEDEGDEHMFFFSWTGNAFSNPAGDGNIDNRADNVIYSGGSNAVDSNGLPLGLTTVWTTGAANAGVNFRVKLMHQPGTKSSTSDAAMGETDVDVTFIINVAP